MRLFNAILFGLVFSVMVMAVSCDDAELPLPNTWMVVDDADQTGTNTNGGWDIPDGVNVQGVNDFNPSVGPASGTAVNAFAGDVYGAASFEPADATFSNAVEMTIPAAGVPDGTYTVYRWNGSSWVAAGTATVSNGTATFSSSSFGEFLLGEMHSQGGGS
jgi:hypothetical protein